MKLRHFPTRPARQHGAVLFVALVFLVLLTLLGLTATSTSILQERMTGSMRNRQLGLMGAESALRGGEAYLWNLAYLSNEGSNPMPPCGNGSVNCVYEVRGALLDTKVQAFRSSKTWIDPGSSGTGTADGARAYSGVSGLTGANATASLATSPRFIIEDIGIDGPASVGQRQGGILQQNNPASVNKRLYRVTARSQGGSDAVVRALESVFSATPPK